MECTCKRCGYVWNTKGDKKPRACVRCKSYFWETPSRFAKKEGKEVKENEER